MTFDPAFFYRGAHRPLIALDMPLPFTSGDVGDGETRTFRAVPQHLFVPKRIVIPFLIAEEYVVQSLKLAGREQFIEAYPVPAMIFGEGVDQFVLDEKKILPNEAVTITVTRRCLDGAGVRWLRRKLPAFVVKLLGRYFAGFRRQDTFYAMVMGKVLR